MVKIVGDTTSSLAASVAQAYDIAIIPQVINFGEESYLEGVDIDYGTFMSRLKTERELPKTAAPPPELFANVFKRHAQMAEPLVCILPSALVSGTVRSAMVAQEILREQGVQGLDVRVIDTGVISSPVATLLQLAAVWARDGMDAATIELKIRAMCPRVRLYFLVDTLKYLAKGGRIGGAAALLGGVLQVKPVLMFREGQVDTFEKVRTHRRAVDRLKELVVEQISPNEDGHLTILHAAAEAEAEELRSYFAERLGVSDIPVHTVPPAVVTHGGPGALGVGFFVEEHL